MKTANIENNLKNPTTISDTNTGNAKKNPLLTRLAIGTVVFIVGTILYEMIQTRTENNHQLGTLENVTITHLSNDPFTSYIRHFIDRQNGKAINLASFKAVFSHKDFNFPFAITGCNGYFPDEVCFNYISKKIGIEIDIETGPEVLLQNGYTTVTHPMRGDVVFYFLRTNTGSPAYTHVGVVSDVNPFQVWIDSKWGIYCYCEHLVSAVPYDYGDEVIYVRKSLTDA